MIVFGFPTAVPLCSLFGTPLYLALISLCCTCRGGAGTPTFGSVVAVSQYDDSPAETLARQVGHTHFIPQLIRLDT